MAVDCLGCISRGGGRHQVCDCCVRGLALCLPYRPPACAVDSRPPQQSSMEEVPAEAPGQSPANDGPVGGGAVPDVPPQDCRDEEMEEHKGEACDGGTPPAAGGGGPGGPGDMLSRWAGHQPAMAAPAHAHAHPMAAKEHGHAPRDVQGGHADAIPTLRIVTGLGEDYKGVESLKEWYMNHKSKPYQASRDLELWLLNVGQMSEYPNDRLTALLNAAEASIDLLETLRDDHTRNLLEIVNRRVLLCNEVKMERGRAEAIRFAANRLHEGLDSLQVKLDAIRRSVPGQNEG